MENNIANARSFVPGLLWSDSTGNRAMEFNICKSLASSRNPVTGFFLSGMERTSATCNDAGNIGNLVLIILTCIPILYTMFVKENDACDYLIILGAHVNGRVPSDSLERRIRKAEQYLKSHPMTKVIVSGGQGKGEDITEAEAMEIYLWEHGIEKERILKETASTTTRENLRFSKALFTPEIVTVGIVTNNFHLHRSCALANRLGYPHVYPISAGCKGSLFLNYMMREVPAM